MSLSKQYAEAGGRQELFQMLATVVGSTRRWAHITELLVIDSWIFLLYCVLYRFKLVPRVLAAFGLATVMLHFAGIPARGFLGYTPVAWMGVPMAFSHLALAGWLVARGLMEIGRPVPEPQAAEPMEPAPSERARALAWVAPQSSDLG